MLGNVSSFELPFLASPKERYRPHFDFPATRFNSPLDIRESVHFRHREKSRVTYISARGTNERCMQPVVPRITKIDLTNTTRINFLVGNIFPLKKESDKANSFINKKIRSQISIKISKKKFFFLQKKLKI